MEIPIESNVDFAALQARQQGLSITQQKGFALSGTGFVSTLNGKSGALVLGGGASGFTLSTGTGTITMASPLTTKGDIYARSAAAGTRLGVGTNGQVLTADSAEVTGLKWVSPGGGGVGTVTSVSVVTANGVSGSVADPTTTPAITLTLGAITPTTIVASGTITVSNTAPSLVLTDTTASAKSLTIAVDANVANFRESSGAAGSLLVLDLANGRMGIGQPAPAQILDILATQDAATSCIVRNFHAGTAAQSLVQIQSDSAVGIQFAAHSSGRTATRYGITLANFGEILATATNGLMVGTFAAKPIIFGTGNTNERMRIDANGSVVVGAAALATNATDGFLYIPTCAGTPTGVPTAYAGRVAMVFDTSNNKFYIYDGGWLGGTTPGAFV